MKSRMNSVTALRIWSYTQGSFWYWSVGGTRNWNASTSHVVP